ncbi:hypothetical protein PR202_gb00013 [Eleusine coracana subsp. coracana]|uniref:TF-B3 domain-containing protein n=1 Tax=Eleusine coracana subsp. coracana TaxID=191504 RepID=A0AAV5DSJ1_ELECO|nr:hypothetical protein PR202_gb00013 [Eleusine coracana subsp. coracana]
MLSGRQERLGGETGRSLPWPWRVVSSRRETPSFYGVPRWGSSRVGPAMGWDDAAHCCALTRRAEALSCSPEPTLRQWRRKKEDFALRPSVFGFLQLSPWSNVVPIHYGDAHFSRKSQIVTLQRPGKNKKWHAKCYIRKDGSSHRYILSSRWSHFVRDNHLRRGDICIFQPTNDTNENFMATVYLLRESKSYSFSGRTRKKTTDANRVSYFEARPRAKVTSTTHAMAEPVDGEDAACLGCNSGRTAHQRHLKCDDPEVPSKDLYMLSGHAHWTKEQVQKVEERVHNIQSEVPIYVGRMIKVSVGASSLQTIVFDKPYVSWHTIVDDNLLAIEDICLFQLMNNERRLTMAVDIIHHRTNSPFLDCYGCVVKQEPDRFDDSKGPSKPPLYVVLSGADLTPAQEWIVEDKVKTIQSGMPIFVAAMNKNIIGDKSIFALDFGTLYAAPYLPEGEQSLTLHRIGWCRSWRAVMHNRRMLDGELCEFARDNRVLVGDICLFELVDIERLTISVHIIRSEQYCVALSADGGLITTY